MNTLYSTGRIQSQMNNIEILKSYFFLFTLCSRLYLDFSSEYCHVAEVP
jgi:hypothetical protein